ncbi:MAG: hypothetical protein V3V96_16435 [Acidiferrobacterales bacterium]
MKDDSASVVDMSPFTCHGWIGVWYDGTLGWWCPTFLNDGCSNNPHTPNTLRADDRLYFCEITVKPKRDKAGRPIIRTAGTLECNGNKGPSDDAE